MVSLLFVETNLVVAAYQQRNLGKNPFQRKSLLSSIVSTVLPLTGFVL
jgi:hypothetical protein